MNRSAILGIVFFLLIFNVGCKDDKLKDDTNVSIESEFRINVWETLAPNERTFQFNIETIKTESCENDAIDIAASFFANDISLNIHDFPLPDCADAEFPATAKFDVGTLSPKVYDLQINLKEVVQNQGILTVTNDYYEIQMEAQNGLSIPIKKLYKVPEKTIWGYVKYSASAENVIAKEFIEAIKGMAIEKEFETGNYGYFSVQNNALTKIYNQSFSSQLIQPFIFEFQGDDIDLSDALNNYRTNYTDMEFKMFTSTGEEL